jgi:hypothetical protein
VRKLSVSLCVFRAPLHTVKGIRRNKQVIQTKVEEVQSIEFKDADSKI